MLYDPKWETPAVVEPVIEPWQQVLINAAKIIQEKGWIKGAFHRGDGFCVVGALRYVTPNRTSDGSHDGTEYGQALNALSTAVGCPMSWNDGTYGLTKIMVVSKLLEVAGQRPSYIRGPAPAPIVVDSSSWTGR